MTTDTDDPFLTIDEAARLLRVSRRTLDNYRCQEARSPLPASRRPHRLPAQRSPGMVRAAPRPPFEGGQEPHPA